MKYSVIIPTYNHCDDLLKPCIDSIFKYTNLADIELIISANGCFDNTSLYLDELRYKFNSLGLANNFKVTWDDKPLGYSKACNAGIELATTDYVILLNNDTILLEQSQNLWLELLEKPFINNKKCGISCIIKSHSEPAGHDFAIFFCVMIHKKVFDKIGLLSLDYGVGGGEDTEFSIECERAGFEVCQCIEKTWNPEIGCFTGNFPIYHKGEGTVFDKTLVPEWDNIFNNNSLTLGRKYNRNWYRWKLSNNYERAVILKEDKDLSTLPREVTRYKWASRNLFGKKILEIGCSTGYGLQFLPTDIDYTGLDYDKTIIEVAKNENWSPNAKFEHADINNYDLGQYDTIIAFEVIEHLDNGLEIVEKLKKHCKRLLITVPYKEPPGFWGEHHRLHMLDESHLPNFDYLFIGENGELLVEPTSKFNLMVCRHDAR
jgi:glycosyltransferase involved in cell wall biosynthesis